MVKYKHQGDLIKKARTKRKLSQGAIAKQLGLTSPQFISNWERYISSYPTSMIPDLSVILKISPATLVAAKVEDYKAQIELEIYFS